MYSKKGPRPGHHVLGVLITLLITMNALADSRVPLTLAEAEDIALSAEPGRDAFSARSQAFSEQSVAAGQLPDPTLRIGLANFPIDGSGFSAEAMTQAQIAIRQEFSKGDSRSHASTRLLAMADEQNRFADARSREVIAATRVAWLEAYHWQYAGELLEESRPFFQDLVTITQAMYAVGRKSQYDVLRAELELTRLDDRVIEAERSLAAAQASLSEWLGSDAFRSPATTLPAWQQLPPVDSLRDKLRNHPVMLAANATVNAQQAGVALAEESKKPGWSMDLGYGYRDGRLPDGRPRSDFINLSVTVDLPLFKKNRQDRHLAAALSERSAAEASRDRLAAQLQSRLALQYSEWQDLDRRILLYETQILGLSEAQTEAAMLAYQSDTGTFSDVMLAYIDSLNNRLEHARVIVERAQAYAAIANLGGLSL